MEEIYNLNFLNMKINKIKIISIFAILFSFWIAFALDNSQILKEINSIENTINLNKETILKLENENKKLVEKISELKKNLNTNSSTWNIVNSWAIKPTSVDKYNKLIDKINYLSSDIFEEYSIWSWASIWLFEFIEPSNFFISIDDWKNPSWVTAFKKKILYSYDNSLNLSIVWIFDLDYKSQYYITKYGKNPFARTTRIRVKNPLYKWLLLEEKTQTITQTNNNYQTSSNPKPTATTTTSSSTSQVSLTDVKNAYNKNKILDALKLSNEYILKDPNNIEVLKIRYRSFYITWKYSDALSEVQKIENIQWDSFEKTIACEWKIIAKLAKNTSLQNKYSDICSKK